LADEIISREVIANTYLSGTGIEVGALHNPLRVPKNAHVKYVDRMSVEELRKHYPELNDVTLVPVDIIADGELLETIGDATQDFVIANHFIEHCANPILAIGNMLRVLKSGGILFIALPDKRHCFDVDRPETTFEHLLKDYQEGPAWSRRAHFEEWARLVNKAKDDSEVEKQVISLMAMDYSIHYHVFTPDTMVDFFTGIKKVIDYQFEYETFFKNGTEVLIILRRV
jgi:SAM-dependent methyltransferase